MEVVSYKCPNCAAALAFNIDGQNWSCQFCHSSFTLPELEAANRDHTGQDVQTDPGPRVAQESTVADAQAEQHSYGGDARVYSCPSCGGTIVTDETTAATFCAYCHNPTVIASQLKDDRRPARMIPFQLDKQAAVEAIQKLCKRKPLLPKDFRRIVKNGEITGLYVPFWLYSCEMDALMQGEARNISTWTDRNYRYTKTDVYRIDRSATMGFQNVPADGSSKMDDKLMHALEPFNYREMVDFSMGYLSGHFAEGYDVDSKEAGRVAQDRIRAGVETKMRELVQGYTSFQITDLKARSRNNACQYVMFPVWVLMAEYKGKTYTYAMNGQTGKAAGKLPTSWARLFGISGAVFAASYLLFMLGGMLA